MADIWNAKKRSEVMSRIRSRGNKDTELKLAAIMRAAGITGWRRHQPVLGRPDFVFRRARLAVFVDGCFWHGCPKHGRNPGSNQKYWLPKLARNRARDLEIAKLLRHAGWRVLRIWEHDLANPDNITLSVREALCQNRSCIRARHARNPPEENEPYNSRDLRRWRRPSPRPRNGRIPP